MHNKYICSWHSYPWYLMSYVPRIHSISILVQTNKMQIEICMCINADENMSIFLCGEYYMCAIYDCCFKYMANINSASLCTSCFDEHQ